MKDAGFFSCSRPASFFLIYAAQMIPFLLVENHPFNG
jgi:hypothetical protein